MDEIKVANNINLNIGDNNKNNDKIKQNDNDVHFNGKKRFSII